MELWNSLYMIVSGALLVFIFVFCEVRLRDDKNALSALCQLMPICPKCGSKLSFESTLICTNLECDYEIRNLRAILNRMERK